MPDIAPTRKSNEREGESTAAVSVQTDRGIPPAGSTRRPWPWRFWGACVLAFVATLIAHFAFKPALAITPATVLRLGDICTVAFEATNNINQPASASLLVIIGCGTPGGDSSPPTYHELARKTMAVTLAPKETKSLTCDLPLVIDPGPHHAIPTPNDVRVEIASYNQQVR